MIRTILVIALAIAVWLLMPQSARDFFTTNYAEYKQKKEMEVLQKYEAAGVIQFTGTPTQL